MTEWSCIELVDRELQPARVAGVIGGGAQNKVRGLRRPGGESTAGVERQEWAG